MTSDEGITKPDFLCVRRAAEQLRLSVGAVYELCRRGLLAHYRIGIGRGAIRIRQFDLSAFLGNCRRNEKEPRRPAEEVNRAKPKTVTRTAIRPFKHIRLPESPSEPLREDDPTAG